MGREESSHDLPPPNTIWSILDHFIVELGAKGDAICSEEPAIKKQLYIGLVNLVCRGDTSVLGYFGAGGPYYHLILVAYYLLFHKKSSTGRHLLTKLRFAYNMHPFTFSDDERCMMGALIDVSNKRPVVFTESDSALCKAFKHLVMYHLTNDARYIAEAEKELEEYEKMLNEPIEQEIRDAYNVIEHRYTSPLFLFLKHVVSRVRSYAH